MAREAGLETPALVVAEHQTAGRGRGSHQWWSRPGALTFSLIINPLDVELPLSAWPRLSLLTGVAVCESLEAQFEQLPVGLKWPNDVWVNHRKAGGILIEVPRIPPGVPQRLVVGIGINLNNSWRTAPAAFRQQSTSLLDETGAFHDPTDLLLRLLHRHGRLLERLAREDPELAHQWQKRDVLRGHTVEVSHASGAWRGKARRIADDGALELDSEEGPRRIFGGSVRRLENKS
jgi:BirA family biotin operon repressor/biotin-[acetyl-CoA-carboxylase] ligase